MSSAVNFTFQVNSASLRVLVPVGVVIAALIAWSSLSASASITPVTFTLYKAISSISLVCYYKTIRPLNPVNSINLFFE